MFEEPHGVVLGCIENMEYEDYVFTVPFGGMLFVFAREFEIFSVNRNLL